MLPTQNGSLRLFRFAGVEVFLHWSWFVLAFYELRARKGAYQSTFWNGVEYLALFGIVLLHEFGHALACRSVGGQADRIVLWPFGGIAFVRPPQRPGPVLWSIAAGPLVNVALVPITVGAWLAGRILDVPETAPDFFQLIQAVAVINLGLLIFNILPVYPLDGGQILRALLWFLVGRATSLRIASAVGLAVGGAALMFFAWHASWWMVALSGFLIFQAWAGLGAARQLGGRRHEDAACPSCGAAPPAGPFWGCGRCRSRFELFETQGTCPGCGARFADAACPECGARRPLEAWYPTPPSPTHLHELPHR